MKGLQVRAFILELGMATNKYKISSWKMYLFSGFKQPEHAILEENHDKIHCNPVQEQVFLLWELHLPCI
jgi:hypothetical protein